MYRKYIKQAIGMLKENPFFSIISILGTAMAITLIMIIVIIYEVQNGTYPPETHRDRMLFVTSVQLYAKEGNSQSYNSPSARILKDCFGTLQTPEAVTLMNERTKQLVTTMDKTRKMKCDKIVTDGNFWKVFDFRFIAGKPFEQSDVESNIRRIVISETVARNLFNMANEEVIGLQIALGRRSYIVSGIVKDVSPLASHAYAHVWVPALSKDVNVLINENSKEGLAGEYKAVILARSRSDFEAIRREAENKTTHINDELTVWQVGWMNQPDTQFVTRLRSWSSEIPDVPATILQYVLVILVLLFVPAMNLSGLASSRMQKRLPEIGVRKAFGATTNVLINQVLTENLFLTLLGGLCGLAISYISVVLLKDWLLQSWLIAEVQSELFFQPEILISLPVFLAALFFCFLLNLLSAGIPAWNASRKNIISTLNA